MALPTISVPTFDVEVYSTKQKVSMRPFLVKEEKILILAAESNQRADMIRAMQQVINSCSDGKIDSEKLPFFDIQNIFIKLRSQSIGKESEFNLICGECGHKTPTILDLDNIELQISPEHKNKIMITPDVGVIMKYPTAEVLVDDDLPVFDLVVSCIDKVFTQDEIHDAKDQTTEEIVEFIEGLTNEQFEKIVEFFVTAPKIFHNIDYTCPKCGTENTVVVDGVENFFG
jgi:Zn finger protein HypA/HybF involved in hydrogenase expression